MDIDKKRRQLLASIIELNKAIEKFRELNTRLNEESNGYWTEDIGKVSDIIKQMLDARSRLEAEVKKTTQKSQSKLLEYYVNTPILNTEQLTQIIIKNHDRYSNWR